MIEEHEKFIEKLVTNNSFDFNLLKAIEELSELSTKLAQYVTKKDTVKHLDILEEMADVAIQLKALEYLFEFDASYFEIVKGLKIEKKIQSLKENDLYSEVFATKEEAEDWLERYKKSKYQPRNEGVIIDQSFDSVNKPKHYMLFPDKDIEIIDVRDAILDKIDLTKWDAKTIDYWSRSWEYLSRAFEKNGLEDMKKSKYYSDRMIKHVDAKTNSNSI